MKVYVILDTYDPEETLVKGVLTSKEKADELAIEPNIEYEEFELDEIEKSGQMKFKDPEPLEDLPLVITMPPLPRINFGKV